MPAVELCSCICGGSGRAPEGKANLIWQMQIHKMCFERLAQCYLDTSLDRSTNADDVLNNFCQGDVERESQLNLKKEYFIRLVSKPKQTKESNKTRTLKYLENT